MKQPMQPPGDIERRMLVKVPTWAASRVEDMRGKAVDVRASAEAWPADGAVRKAFATYAAALDEAASLLANRMGLPNESKVEEKP